MLSNRLNSEPPEFRAKLLLALDVGEQTLYRWARGRNKPDSKSKINTLMRYIPEMSEELRKSFPQYFTSPHEINLRLVAPYGQRVFEAYESVEEGMIFRAITHIVMDGLVTLLDPNGVIGVLAFLTQLHALPGETKATYLTIHAWSAHGSGIWADEKVRRSFHVGGGSLSALAVTQREEVFYHRDQQTLPSIPNVCNADAIESAAAYPILKSGHVAGVVFVSSVQKDFFISGERDLTDRRDLIKRFVRMMPLAFREDQFYTKVDFGSALTAEQRYLYELAQDYPDDTPEQLKTRAVARLQEC